MTKSFAGLTAETPDKRDFLQGQLLVAMPNLREGCFKQSLVLICSHDEDHAMGLILNKAISDLSFAELLDQVGLDPAEDVEDRPIHFGGPVDTKRGVVLHTDDYRTEDTVDIMAGLCLTATRDILADLNVPDGAPVADGRPVPAQALICAGHAGWSGGQLEHELVQNAWLTMPAAMDLIFTDNVDTVWQEALSRLGVDQSMFSAAWSETRNPDAPLN